MNNILRSIFVSALEVFEATAVSVYKKNTGPEKIIDGDINTFWHSKQWNGKALLVLWVQLDLYDIVSVNKVIIFNQQQNSGDTAGLKVLVGYSKIDNQISELDQQVQMTNMNECGEWLLKAEAGELMEVVCHKPSKGSVVVIHQTSRDTIWMSLAEVKVYGKGTGNQTKFIIKATNIYCIHDTSHDVIVFRMMGLGLFVVIVYLISSYFSSLSHL